jgi:hypothetical protein
MTNEINTNGDKRISSKWLHPERYDYLIKAAKEENLSQTSILNDALKLREKSKETK